MLLHHPAALAVSAITEATTANRFAAGTKCRQKGHKDCCLRQRLGAHAARTRFHADFKTEAWPEVVGGPFDFVLSLQAVHELRHERYGPRLCRQLLPLLAPAAEVLICDHLPEGYTRRATECCT